MSESNNENLPLRFLTRFQEAILAVCILAISFLTMANVFCRFVLGFSLAMASEVSEFCIIITTFIGLAYGAVKARHIRMTAIYDLFSQKQQKSILIVSQILTSLILIVLTGYASQYVSSVYQLGGIYPATGVPFYLIYAFAPLGFFLAAVQYAATAWMNLTRGGIFRSIEVQQDVPAATVASDGQESMPC